MFKKAKPVFLKDLSHEMNITGTFICSLPAVTGAATLYIAAATHYKAYLNGALLNFGPARAAHGYARVDELPLELAHGGELRIDVASYNCHAFDGVTHPGFLTAEVRQGADVLAATGCGDDFAAYRNLSRVQKVMRFSYQRHFSEVYDGIDKLEKCELETVAQDMQYIPREVPLPCIDEMNVPVIAARGSFTQGEPVLLHDRFVEDIPEHSDAFPRADFQSAPYDEYCGFDFTVNDAQPRDFAPLSLQAGEYVLCDFGRALTGFLRAQVKVVKPAKLIIAYEEYCPDGYVPFKRLQHQYVHIVTYDLPVGAYSLESFEPVDFRYIQLTPVSGAIDVSGAGMRKFMHPECGGALDSGDAKLDEIYEAALSTFRQNSLDVYMDCPTRERAGWLCDSYYSAQSEYEFTGGAQIERPFLRNFVQAGHIDGLPEGMLAMSYPSDVLNGEFIPQWAMWYVMELRDHLTLRDTSDDRDYYKKLCYDLLAMLVKYENSDGLLEDLPGWNFVEWSKCNEWTRDVNYPTNFLYAAVLEAVGGLYGDAALIEKCAAIRATTARLAFDGQLFVDNAVRGGDGRLVNTGNVSETCQYYAMRFGKIDIDEPQYAYLKNAFVNIFGPDYAKYDALGRHVEHSEAFMGTYIRMELLLARGMYAELLGEIKGFFGNMAYLTGTLWEHDDVYGGSLNHGFASFAAVAIKRALAGLKKA